MSEGSLATGVWIITQGCAARTITAVSGNARQQQLTVETLVPGQSVGWEELTLQLRPDFARQVNSPPSSPPSLPPLPPLFFSAHTFSHGCTAGSRHKHIERRCPDRRPHYFCPGKRNKGHVLQSGVFVCPSAVRPACPRCVRSHVSSHLSSKCYTWLLQHNIATLAVLALQ
jgi:hypothetical protein